MKVLRNMFALVVLFLVLIPGKNAEAALPFKVGDYVQFGSYHEKPISWRVINVDSVGNPLLFANSNLTYKEMNGRECEEYYDSYCLELDLDWETADLRKWLNSKEPLISYLKGKPTFSDEKGFLHPDNFTELESSKIKTVRNKVVLTENTNYYLPFDGNFSFYNSNPFSDKMLNHYDNFSYIYVNDRVFFLSTKELNDYVIKRNWKVMSDEKNQYTEMPENGSSNYFLRTAASNDGFYTVEDESSAYIDRSGKLYGVRPAMYIHYQAFNFGAGNGTKEYPYTEKEAILKLNSSNMTIERGKGKAISYQFKSDVKDKITFKSSNTKIATVSKRGVINGVSEGKATITLKTTSQVFKINITVVQKKSSSIKTTVLTAKDKTYSGSNNYLGYDYVNAGDTKGFFDYKGNYQVAYETDKWISIKIYSPNMVLQKTVKIPKRLNDYGDITIDENDNYYIIWGKDVDEKSKKSKNIIIVKYNTSGKKIAEKAFISGDINTKIPFIAGTASIAFNDGIIAAQFARQMFKSSDGFNHQASQTVYVDSQTMKKLNIQSPYTSHSFNQMVIPTSDEKFLFVDHGDGYSRGFVLSKIKDDYIEEVTTFHFREGEAWDYGYNYTFAQLGGITENTNSYSLVAASEKTLSAKQAPSRRNESHNLFLQTFIKDFESIYNNKNFRFEFTKENLLTEGPTRKLTGKWDSKKEGRKFLSKGVEDYGVKWLTNYTGNIDVVNPKVVATDDDRLVILWDKYKNSEYNKTYYMIVTPYGDVLQEATEIKVKDVELSGNMLPVYKNGTVYWMSYREDDKIFIHRLKID